MPPLQSSYRPKAGRVNRRGWRAVADLPNRHQFSGNCPDFLQKTPEGTYRHTSSFPGNADKGVCHVMEVHNSRRSDWSRAARLRDALAAVRAAPRASTGRRERTPAHRTVAFTIAVTTLAAKMAKADGVALPVEARAFEEVFAIPPEEATNVQRLYDLAKQDVAGYEYLRQQDRPALEGRAASSGRRCWSACSTSRRPTASCTRPRTSSWRRLPTASA